MQVKTMNEIKAQGQSEALSALADGELGRAELAQWLATPAAVQRDLEATWAAYHVIGDTLRGSDHCVGHGKAGFLQRLQVRLEAEGPLVAQPPAPAPVLAVAPVATVAPVARQSAPANDANFRWKLVAGVASVSALAFLTWGMLGAGGSSGLQQQLAVARPAQPVASQTFEQASRMPGGEEQIMIRDARLDELLATHRQGGTTAFPMPAGVLRSATFASPER